MAFGSYAAFAAVAAWLERRPAVPLEGDL
jgi:hypothetical protein